MFQGKVLKQQTTCLNICQELQNANIIPELKALFCYFYSNLRYKNQVFIEKMGEFDGKTCCTDNYGTVLE